MKYANINSCEAAKRRRFGLVMVAVAGALAVVLFVGGYDRIWRLLVLLPTWAAAQGILQAYHST
jgi:hypothetical protein